MPSSITISTLFSNAKKVLSYLDKIDITSSEVFEKFKKENDFWLEKEAIYQALVHYYKTDDLNMWNEIDKELYNLQYPENLRIIRIEQIKNDLNDEINFQKTVQFFASYQQKQAKIRYNQMGIKVYGDRLIGFSQSEKWANKACFLNNEFYGAFETSWGICAPDYNLVGECDGYDKSKLGITGKLFYDVFCEYFKRYDGIRVDAGFQLLNPIIYNAKGERQYVKNIGFTLLNIVKLAARDTLGDKFNENEINNIMMEFCGMISQDNEKGGKNQFPQLFETLWRRNCKSVKQYKDSGINENFMCIGLGSHDNDTLVSKSRTGEFRESCFKQLQIDYLHNFNEKNLEFKTQNYQTQPAHSKREENFRTAKFAEIFTTKKHFFSLPDVFGMQERINIGNQINPNNWKVRIPSNYEEFYFSQLSKGYGLNMPKALANALKMKDVNDKNLIKKLEEAAEILRAEGPNTILEADSTKESLGKLFTYNC